MSTSRNKGGFLLFIVVFLLLGLLALPILKAMPNLAPSQHANTRHGADANFVRQKCDEDDPSNQVWREKRDPSEFIQICNLGNGQWGVRPFRVEADGTLAEKTAYIYTNKSGSLSDLLFDLSKHATRYTGPLP